MKISENTLSFIRSSIQDFEFGFDLAKSFSSAVPTYRENIRSHLLNKYSSHFNRTQLAQLSDLNIIPKASQGFFSISHCHSWGGFSYSQLPHGFDVEVIGRISTPVLNRTSGESERSAAPDIKFLWVAKEAAYKAFANEKSKLLMTDLICEKWKSHPETQVHSFRITSEKTLDTKLNTGFVFSEEDVHLAVYFR